MEGVSSGNGCYGSNAHPDFPAVGMKVPGAAGLAQWATEHTRAFHRTLWDFCNDRFFFLSKPHTRRVFLSHGYNMQEGRMNVSALILILLLTFAGAGALERLRSTLIK